MPLRGHCRQSRKSAVQAGAVGNNGSPEHHPNQHSDHHLLAEKSADDDHRKNGRTHIRDCH